MFPVKMDSQLKRKYDAIANMDRIRANLRKKRRKCQDPKLVARIHELLRNHGKTPVLVLNRGWIVSGLQKRYVEYDMTNIKTLRKAVDKAYDHIIMEERRKNEEKLQSQDFISLDTKPQKSKPSSKSVSREVSGNESDGSKSFSSDNEYVTYPDTNSMNNLVSGMYKKSKSLPCSRNVSAAPSPVHKTEDADMPTLEEKNERAEESMDKSMNNSGPITQVTQSPEAKLQPFFSSSKLSMSISLPSSPASIRPTEDFPSEELVQKKTSTPFTLASKERRMEDLAKNRGDVIEKEKESDEQKKSESAAEESKQKVIKKKRRTERKRRLSEATSDGPQIQVPSKSFANLAGIDKQLLDLYDLMMKTTESFARLGLDPRGVLLHGPSGCGKTLLAQAIAGQMKFNLLQISATEIVSGVSGESESKVRDLFEKAVSHAPCVLLLDEIDAICQKRDSASKNMESRIVSQLGTCMDELAEKKERVFVVGTTNRIDSIDPALRRGRRFEREIPLGIPNEASRKSILQLLCQQFELAEGVEHQSVARLTPGYVGNDLAELVKEAAGMAIFRALKAKCGTTENEMSKSEELTIEAKLAHKSAMFDTLMKKPDLGTDVRALITMEDFKESLKKVQPSALREGYAMIPNVTWEDIGALKDITKELQTAILTPVHHPEDYAVLRKKPPSGVLLAGPPGCGKTLLAKAIANEGGINFISVKGPELFNMYVGESERGVRQVFERAQNSAPCVIFFDEIDALCPKRSSENRAGERVVNQMLTLMDGAEERKQVFVIGATNRPDMIDEALLRPGRLDKILFVGLPTPEDRWDILKALTRNGTSPPCSDDVDLQALANDERCTGYSGADLDALVGEACSMLINERVGNPDPPPLVLTPQYFEQALANIIPSVNKENQRMYDEMKKKMVKS